MLWVFLVHIGEHTDPSGICKKISQKIGSKSKFYVKKIINKKNVNRLG
jgi:hypothetical protein